MSFFRRLFSSKSSAAAGSAQPNSRTVIESPRVVSQVQYPPVDGGLPLASVEELMEGQADLIARVRINAALPHKAFEDRYIVPIQNLASYILNLPATQDREYGGPGGLFRASLDLAFLSFQAADGRIFTGMLGVEDRHKLETRWRYICFAAGLLWPVGKTIESIRVQGNGSIWPARKQGLGFWSKEAQVSQVFLTWPRGTLEPGPSVNGSALAVNILGDKAIEWLEQGSPQMMTALIEVSAGIRKEFNSIAYDVIASMWKKALTLEQARMPSNYGRVKYGQHLAPYIIDALRGLLREGVWSINRSPLHVDSTGIYLQWPTAAQDILRQLASKGIAQTPESPEALMTMMADEDLIKIDQLGGAFNDIADADGVITSALKLLKPNIVIPDYDPREYAKASPAETSKVQADSKAAKQGSTETKGAPAHTEQSAPTQSEVASSAPRASSDEVLAPPPPAADPLAATIGMSVDAPTPSIDQEEAAQPSNSEPADSHLVVTKAAAPEEASKKAENPPQQTYKDILPHGVIKSINDGLVSGQLVKLIDKLKTDAYKERLLFTEKYIAVPWDSFDGVTLNPASFLSKLGDAGYLHADPKARGKKMHELPVSPNSTVKDKYYLLARILTDKLGLTDK